MVFFPPPFKAPSFHHLKSSLLCPVRDALSLLHPPANTEYQAKFQELRLEEWLEVTQVLISNSRYHEESRTINNTPSVIGAASDCDALRKTKDVRSNDHGSHSSEGRPKEARVRHLPKDFKGVFLPPVCVRGEHCRSQRGHRTGAEGVWYAPGVSRRAAG